MVSENFDEDIILSTSPILETHEINEQKGLVVANVTLGRHVGKDILAGLRDTFGGRSKSWENSLTEAQEDAVGEIVEEAKKAGANAVIGLTIVDESITEGIKNVKVVGTAVKVK